nr:hypothetical protein [Tanacetum cinerariifolium]
KILVPKLPKNYARCGHPVDGLYCQGCSLLRKKLEEDLVTYFQDFQNTSESSDDSINIVNAPREPFVVKQDHGVNSSQNPPHIDECCCECGYALDGIFCQQCTCKSCGKGAYIGYNCPPKVSIISNLEPCNQTMNNELPQTLPIFNPMCYSDKENLVPCVSKPNFVDESSNIFKPPPQPPIYSCEFCGSNAQYGHYCTPQVPFIYPEQGIPDTMCDVHLVNNLTPLEAKDHFEIVIKSNDDISSSDDDSLYNENIESDFTHEEFADELAHIISPPEYDCFYFRNFPDPGELISILNFGIRENLYSTTRVNLPVEDDHSPLLAYVVKIFLAYLTYPVIPPYLHSFGNEDTIFDPGIAINRFYSFKLGLSHRCGTFKKFNTHHSHLNEIPMEMLFSTCFLMDQ